MAMGTHGKRWLLALVALTVLIANRMVQAGNGCGGCCPQCNACCPVPEVIKEKKHKWEVECKQVCVPAIKWPWQKCCEPPRCGYTRTVKVLKKFEYECEKCGYKWEIRDCGAGNCAAGSCAEEAGPADAAPAPSPPIPPKPVTLVPAGPEFQATNWQPANRPARSK